MGCENSTAKSADDKKGAAQNQKGAPAAKSQKPAQKPAEKAKSGAVADDATHLTVATSPAATPAASPVVPTEPVKEDEKKKESEAEKKAEEAKAEEAEAATAEEVVVVDPAEQPAVPAEAAEAEAQAEAKAEAEAPVVDATPEESAAAAAAAQVATAPAEEDDDASPEEHRRQSAAAPIHQESQTQRAADPNSPYAGPGPEETFPIDNIYRCFEEGNGLLFRIVNKKRHLWAFYNDTTEYMMRVSVTFGPESSVTALDDTQVTVANAETGESTLVLDVPPGATKQFMRGEYNGFTTSYDANPVDNFEEKLEAMEDEPIVQPLQFTGAKAEATSEGGNVPLEDASDGGTRIHFMETDPSKEEPADDLKKRHEEA